MISTRFVLKPLSKRFSLVCRPSSTCERSALAWYRRLFVSAPLCLWRSFMLRINMNLCTELSSTGWTCTTPPRPHRLFSERRQFRLALFKPRRLWYVLLYVLSVLPHSCCRSCILKRMTEDLWALKRRAMMHLPCPSRPWRRSSVCRRLHRLTPVAGIITRRRAMMPLRCPSRQLKRLTPWLDATELNNA